MGARAVGHLSLSGFSLLKKGTFVKSLATGIVRPSVSAMELATPKRLLVLTLGLVGTLYEGKKPACDMRH